MTAVMMAPMPLERMIATDPKTLTRIRIAHFLHEGKLRGSVSLLDGVSLPCQSTYPLDPGSV